MTIRTVEVNDKEVEKVLEMLKSSDIEMKELGLAIYNSWFPHLYEEKIAHHAHAHLYWTAYPFC